MEIKYIKSATRLLKRNALSKEVLWVSIGQRAAELPAIEVGGLKKNSAAGPGASNSGLSRAEQQNIFLNLQI